MAAPILRAVITPSQVSDASCTLTLPGTVVAGDHVLAVSSLYFGAVREEPAGPGGWEKLGVLFADSETFNGVPQARGATFTLWRYVVRAGDAGAVFTWGPGPNSSAQVRLTSAPIYTGVATTALAFRYVTDTPRFDGQNLIDHTTEVINVGESATAVGFLIDRNTQIIPEFGRPAGATFRGMSVTLPFEGYVFDRPATAGSVQQFRWTNYADTRRSDQGGGWTLVLGGNVAPLAPTLLYPVGGAAINRLNPLRISYRVNDPDAGDSQRAAELEWISGTAAPVLLENPTPNQFFDAPGAYFPAGQISYRIRTQDREGLWGRWSPTEFFEAATPPPGPTITSPLAGATITSSQITVVWSGTGASFAVRTVADLNGNPDPSRVYETTGTVPGPGQAAAVRFLVNNRAEHIQVMTTSAAGLPSPWSSVRVNVLYTAPRQPTLAVTRVRRGLDVLIVNPVPVGDQPVVTHNHLWRRRAGEAPRRIARDIPAGVFSDRRVAHRVEYEYQVEAVGRNGTTSLSGWTSTATVVVPVAGRAWGAGAWNEGVCG